MYFWRSQETFLADGPNLCSVLYIPQSVSIALYSQNYHLSNISFKIFFFKISLFKHQILSLDTNVMKIVHIINCIGKSKAFGLPYSQKRFETISEPFSSDVLESTLL